MTRRLTRMLVFPPPGGTEPLVKGIGPREVPMTNQVFQNWDFNHFPTAQRWYFPAFVKKYFPEIEKIFIISV